MPVVRRIRRPGVTISVEAHAEVLFMPGGEVNRWKIRFLRKIRDFTIAAAPTNKRPRWAHYGKPLKGTIFSVKPNFQSDGRDGMRLYGAVGSTAPHAYYVNEGTGVFNGSGPYPAKILPPWTHGGSSLYEHTWKPFYPEGRRVSPIMIKGQPGQFFMDRGLADAMRYMRLRAYQVAAEPRITDAISARSTGVDGYSGATPWSFAFDAQLREWRAWRDEAWDSGAGRLVGEGETHRRISLEDRRHNAEVNSKYVKGYKVYLTSGKPRKRRLTLQEYIAETKKASDRRYQRDLQAERDKAARKRKGLLKQRRAAIESERNYQLGRLRLQASTLASKYANADYTGVKLQATFNKERTVQTGWRVVFTSPSGESGSTAFKVNLKAFKAQHPKPPKL